MLRFGLLFTLALAGSATLLDRIEVVVDHQVITELALEEDIRVTAFLNEAPVSASIEQRRAAVSRLIDQSLIEREMTLSHYPWTDESAITEAVDQVRQAQGGNFDLNLNLSRYQLSLAELRQHLALQAAILRFVAVRFRPELGISDADMEEYYRRQTSTWTTSHPNQPVPSFDNSRAEIRRALIEERTNRALDDWLRAARSGVKIAYLDGKLQGNASP
jgi:hypothetical protein